MFALRFLLLAVLAACGQFKMSDQDTQKLGLDPDLSFSDWSTSNSNKDFGDGERIFIHVPEFFDPQNPETHLISDTDLKSETNWAPKVSEEFPPSVARSIQRVVDYAQSEFPLWSKISENSNVLPNDPALLNDWLAKRIQKFYFEEEFLEEKIFIEEFNFSFPFPNDQIALLDLRFPFEMASSSNIKVSPLASNIGAHWYLRAKQEKQLWVAKVDSKVESEELLVDSPRIGFLKIHRALFSRSQSVNLTKPLTEANSIKQASVLFHEARHSDGHDIHAGFVHSQCPENNVYKGLAACDQHSQGAHGAGAEFLILAIKNCATCSEGEKQILRTLYLDMQERILSVAGANSEIEKIDDRAEKIVLKQFPVHSNSSLGGGSVLQKP